MPPIENYTLLSLQFDSVPGICCTTLTACFFVGSFPMILSMTALVTGSLLWKFAAGSTSVGFVGGPGVGVGAGPVTVGRDSGATRV